MDSGGGACEVVLNTASALTAAVHTAPVFPTSAFIASALTSLVRIAPVLAAYFLLAAQAVTAFPGEPPTAKPSRFERSAQADPVQPFDSIADMSMKVSTRDGVLLVMSASGFSEGGLYVRDALNPEGAVNSEDFSDSERIWDSEWASASERVSDQGSSFYLALWNNYATHELYIFSHRIYDQADLGNALFALARDLGVNVLPMIGANAGTPVQENVLSLLQDAIVQAAFMRRDHQWTPASIHLIYDLAGLELPVLDLPDGDWQALGGKTGTTDGSSDGSSILCVEPQRAPVDEDENKDEDTDRDVDFDTKVERPHRPGPNEPLVFHALSTISCGNIPGEFECPSDGNDCTDDIYIGQSLRGQGGIVWMCVHVPVPERPCTPDAEPCTDDICGVYGTCVHPDKPNGEWCPDDGKPCTDDICINGDCDHPDEPDGASCPDEGDPCTEDICDNGSCTHPPGNDGAECYDDGNECTDDICDDGECDHPDITTCDPDEEENPCLIIWCCQATGCVEESICDDDDPCTNDICDPTDPEDPSCSHTPLCEPYDTCADLGCNVSVSAPDVVPLNDDDDNRNGIADYMEPGPIGLENDLKRFTFNSVGNCTPIGDCIYDASEYSLNLDPWGVFGLFMDQYKTETFDHSSWPPVVDEGWLEGRNPTTGYGIPLHVGTTCPSRIHQCSVSTDPIVVVRVTKLEWQKPYSIGAGSTDPCDNSIAASNEDLSRCPNNGGVRIFPGWKEPNDHPYGVYRNDIDLVATIDPPIAGVIVYFKMFDVDDPFDELHGPQGIYNDIPNVNVIDLNGHNGYDNFGGGYYLSATLSDTTNEFGQARVSQWVTMQPGDNFRAVASCIYDAVDDQVSESMTGALSYKINEQGKYEPNGDFSGYQTPVVWSKMLTVWRKLHVETDSMVRPTFAQNTFTMDWNEPRVGAVSTQVVFEVNAPPVEGGDTEDQQFTQGYVQLLDGDENVIVTARVIDYVTHEPAIDDEVTVNLSDCGNGVSGLDCLGGITDGKAIFSDDDLSDLQTFNAKVWGCDNSYSGPVGSIAPPDLSIMEERYKPAYILPVHDTEHSAVQGLVTFLRNVDLEGIGSNDGKVLWDQALAARNLPISTSNFWTVMVVSAWQAEEPEDADPNSEDQVGNGVTKGINTHKVSFLGSVLTIGFEYNYTGICAVFREVFGETNFLDYEKYTVVHEVGHTFGLDHREGGAMCEKGDCQREPFQAVELKELREYVDP